MGRIGRLLADAAGNDRSRADGFSEHAAEPEADGAEHAALLAEPAIHSGGQPEPQLLSLLREYDAPLALPPLNGDRDVIIAAIAREVKFSAENAARLPFSIAAENIEKALQATETHHYSQG